MAGPPNQPPGPDDETVVGDEWGPEDETIVKRVEEAEEPPGPREPKIWPFLIALLVLVLGGLGALWYFTQDGEDDGATAPATVTQTVSVPAETTTGTTTEAATTGQTTTSETTTGETTTTAPPQPATVPNVVGRPLADAARELGDQNLIVEALYGPADEAAAGTVVAQAQPPGTELSPGDTVLLSVSQGVNPATFTSLPDVVGLERNDASERLDAEGFEVLAFEVDEGNEGEVVFQSPEAGAAIPGGSLVLLYVGA